MPLIDPPPADDGPEKGPPGDTKTYSRNTQSAMARRPDIQKAQIALFDAIMETHSRVTPELKMLLAHVVSSVAGCRFCQAHTAFFGEKGTFFDEVSTEFPDRLDSIWEYATSPLFSDAERAALDLAAGAGVTPNGVTPEMRGHARQFWDDGELAEIVAIISFFGITNRWHDTVATPLEVATIDFATERLTKHGWELGKH